MAILLGIIAALVAGVVLTTSHASGASVALGSGAGFATTVTLTLLIEKELGLLGPRP